MLSVIAWAGNFDLFGHQGVKIVLLKVGAIFRFAVTFFAVGTTTVLVLV